MQKNLLRNQRFEIIRQWNGNESLDEWEISYRALSTEENGFCGERRKILFSLNTEIFHSSEFAEYSTGFWEFTFPRCNGILAKRYFDLYPISFHLLKIIFSYWISSPTPMLRVSAFHEKIREAYTTTLSIQFKFIWNVNNDSFCCFSSCWKGFACSLLYASHLNHLLVSHIFTEEKRC